MNAQAQELQPATPKKSLLAAMASRFNMEAKTFEQTIMKTLMPTGTTNEQLAAFLIVADQYDLNPVTREIHAFPSKGGGIQPVVGIDGWINLAQRRPELDGIEYKFEDDDDGNPVSCTCYVYRKDRGRPVCITEYMDECRRDTQPWKSHPRRMLRHKATIQAIRYTFGFSGIKDEDDAEIIYANATVIENKTSPTTNALMEKSRTLRDQDATARESDPTKENAYEKAKSEWPQQDDKGIWRDSRGIGFMVEVHGMSSSGIPAVTKSGEFCKRRGCDQRKLSEMEAAALAALSGAASDSEPEPEQSTDQEPATAENWFDVAQDSKGDTPTNSSVGYPEIHTAIARAASMEACDEAEDLLRSFDGQDEHRAELQNLLTVRRERLAPLIDE